ncbi:MAG TPA: adenylyltransferase/cytidyltransferase family protein [Candidatus Nanoarchaeia archaeon]|nr:adenylyltransferase/cytidyltransferase family protein [Candidatus Nanoarchaeia archaeon]
MPAQNKGQTVVLASGVFDLLHLGHVKFLEEAKKYGGKDAKLVVVIARDKTVEKTKGRRPVVPESERRMLVESLKVVDQAVLGSENFNLGEMINAINPDVIALGYDQTSMEKRVEKFVAENGLNIKVIQVGKYVADELDSSSKIQRKIVEKWIARQKSSKKTVEKTA